MERRAAGMAPARGVDRLQHAVVPGVLDIDRVLHLEVAMRPGVPVSQLDRSGQMRRADKTLFFEQNDDQGHPTRAQGDPSRMTASFLQEITAIRANPTASGCYT